jgi:Flp pilus assembly protein TadB
MARDPLTARERDGLLEDMAGAIVAHEAESGKRHSDLTARMERHEAQQTRIIEALARLDTSAWGLLTRLVERATGTAAGTVALLSLIAVLALIAAAVYLGSEQVLSIVAGRVSLSPQSDPQGITPAPETP